MNFGSEQDESALRVYPSNDHCSDPGNEPGSDIGKNSNGSFENLMHGEAFKQFHIRTFGCQMNVADTQRMAAILGEKGMSEVDDPKLAQLIIINGCSVREKAVHKAVSALGLLQKLKGRKNGGGAESGIYSSPSSSAHSSSSIRRSSRGWPIIGIGGCVAQLDKENLFRKAPYVDFVFGTDAIDQLPELIHRVQSGERHVIYTEFDKSMDYSIETKIYRPKAQAYINIMKGCDKYCSYCIVPFTRGREKSRTIDEVIADIAYWVANGVREVTLLGQNVNSFGKGNPNLKGRQPSELKNVIGPVGPRKGDENFPQLLRALDTDPRCSQLKRIRFTSSHPLDFSDELINCYAMPDHSNSLHDRGGILRLANHLHLPVQSGSNRILQLMGRHHRIETYKQQIKHLKVISPDVGLSTDLIVGFPTETEDDFQSTIELLNEIQFDNVFAFAYSVRPGTKAAKMKDDVSDEVKNRRLNFLLKHQLKISEGRYLKRVGKVFEILVEGEAKNQNWIDNLDRQRSEGFQEGEQDETPSEMFKVLAGRTSCNRVVNFKAIRNREMTGQWVNVKILHSTALSLYGDLEKTE